MDRARQEKFRIPQAVTAPGLRVLHPHSTWALLVQHNLITSDSRSRCVRHSVPNTPRPVRIHNLVGLHAYDMNAPRLDPLRKVP